MLNKMIQVFTGPFLVGLAAVLWSTDALIRYPSIKSIDATFLVIFEHILAVFILLPWAVFKYKKQFFRLSLEEWISAVFSGVGGSAIAMLFFTASFLYVNPSVAVLLQKLQPIVVVLIAYVFLGERPARKFYFWGLVALAAGIILSFPDFDFSFLSGSMSLYSKGIQYAAGATILWAASTVTGKILLKKTPILLATFWRFFFGLIALVIIFCLSQAPMSLIPSYSGETLFSLLYLSLVSGLLAMLVYYAGLARTPATITTFIELIYPIGAVILNTVFLDTPLESVQMIAGGVLVFAVAMISF
jgi:drug/metabolite transporter (DMT)-like permease